MGKKPKFKPKITRVKLNPEQAVLSCNCYNVGRSFERTGDWGTWYPLGTSNRSCSSTSKIVRGFMGNVDTTIGAKYRWSSNVSFS